MIDAKRIGYLFGLALVIGLCLVYLRTAHMQAMYRMTSLAEEHRDLSDTVRQQQMLLSGALETPQQIRDRLVQLDVAVCQPDTLANVSAENY